MAGILASIFGGGTKKQKPKRRAPKTSFGKGPNRMESAAKNDAKRRRNVMDEIRNARRGN